MSNASAHGHPKRHASQERDEDAERRGGALEHTHGLPQPLHLVDERRRLNLRQPLRRPHLNVDIVGHEAICAHDHIPLHIDGGARTARASARRWRTRPRRDELDERFDGGGPAHDASDVYDLSREARGVDGGYRR